MHSGFRLTSVKGGGGGDRCPLIGGQEPGLHGNQKPSSWKVKITSFIPFTFGVSAAPFPEVKSLGGGRLSESCRELFPSKDSLLTSAKSSSH
ncbi:hypothetical protein NQZ68_017017 [Dissostichus eleginoides]|nr:hypothetical protein NQZ68_017017 [Dissostichus eleginoides]